MKQLVFIISGLLALAWAQAGSCDDAELYGEEASYGYKEGKKWKELDLVLPGYPAADDLIEVDLALDNFPFSLWIDSRSLTVGDDRVIRYTAVLRSETGAENVVYEGIRCPKRQYRRYAYGSGGKFHQVERSKWRFLGKGLQDRYRAELIKNFLCPLPVGDRSGKIIRKLKNPNPGIYSDLDD